MNLRNNYQKLKKHLRTGGLLYAFWRGVKYFTFLIKKQKERLKQLPKNMISKGKIKIICSDSGINIFWSDCEVTKGSGLNLGINTLGLWTDSSMADWLILEKGVDNFKIKVIFRYLPLSQIWSIKIKDGQEIEWQIDLEIEGYLHIDEFRIISLIAPRYKTWFSGYQQADFPRLDHHWHELCVNNTPTSLVGVRFSVGGKFLPSFVLETPYKNLLPFIQNPPLNINTRLIGFRYINPEEKKDYSPGQYHLFSGRINLFEDNFLLDNKIENLRRNSFETVVKEKTKDRKSIRKLKILLANLPWQRDGKIGVRAGSRWPHIKDKSEGNYLPFPFFLAYATSLLQKHNIDANLVDAIAEETAEDKFLEKILGKDFDYLVAETSVPSFYDDLKILKRIHHTARMPIILCGPNSEIYKPEFLKKYPFIDFVLFGEYEFTLLELVKALQKDKTLSGINGLIYCNGNGIVKNPRREPLDINLLPWPYRENLPMNKYWDLPGDIPYPSVQMITSRGCPFGCNFCLWPQVLYQNNIYRVRDINDVVDEMEYLVKEKGFKSVYFDDDTFNIGKERMLKFCRTVKERGLHNIPWAIMARPDLMEEEILTEMKSAGLWAVKYGVETIHDKLLDNCQKNMDFRKANRMIRMTTDLGIKTHLTFSFGLDGETKESMQGTIDYVLNLRPNSVQFSILTPFPGTRLFEEMDKQGRILTKDWSKYDGHHQCIFQPDNLSPAELGNTKRQAYRIWGEHLRKRRGLRGDMKRLGDYLKKYGFTATLFKTLDYLNFIWIKEKQYLNGNR